MTQLDTFKALLDKGNDNELLRYSLGNAYFKQNDFKQSIIHLKKAISHKPTFSAAWKLYAKALTANNQNDEAIVAYEKGINIAEITMHVGLGTFNPVEVADLSKHKMDSEELFINEKACNIINGAKVNKKRICAVGTTSMRGIESSVSSVRTLNPYSGWTHKFIFPPYDFRIADSMITNFHTPKSTLLMMASAFAGPDFIKEAYSVAIKEKYNFYSYGDAMLII